MDLVVILSPVDFIPVNSISPINHLYGCIFHLLRVSEYVFNKATGPTSTTRQGRLDVYFRPRIMVLHDTGLL
jgi:hypothetical protein